MQDEFALWQIMGFKKHMRIKTKSVPFFALCVILFLSLWMIPAISHAGTMNQIKLSDGSLIQAEIISFSNGVYKLRSDALGVFSLAEDRIQSISPNKTILTENPPQLNAADSLIGQQMQRLQQELMSDPATMKMLSDLQNDPAIRNILQDKELMQAIEQGNFNRVGQDPKIQSLMNSKAVENIIKQHQPN